MCIYCFVELIFKNFMGDYYSFATVSDGAARIAQYALIFLKSASPKYFLCLIPSVIFSATKFFINDLDVSRSNSLFTAAVLVLIMFPTLSNRIFSDTQLMDSYRYFDNKDLIIDRFGMNHFLVRDLVGLHYKPIKPVEAIEEEIIEEVVETDEDELWHSYISTEENERMKTIDNYLISKDIVEDNEYTGIFEGYNYIYFMTEALDYLSIDPELTPTLYRMYEEGMTFYNHYTPLYSCATGESEYVSYTSIFPYVDLCTPNAISGQQMYQALPYLFKDKGYTNISLHNWRDEFYERNTIMYNIGFDNYTDIDDIWSEPGASRTSGWQSDKELIEEAIEQIDTIEGNFFCNIITSVMHFPYDSSSYWGDYYLSEINKVHPEWNIEFKRYMSKCMNFDDGLKTLLDYLDQKGIADKTVICIYPDHRPYWLDYSKVISYTNWINDRSGDYGIYRSPFIIYNPQIEASVNYNYCSTLDHAPTIANLFNLNYDSRLYMGEDIFAGNKQVVFNNGSWLNEEGIYDSTKDVFYPYEQKEYDESYIDSLTDKAKDTIRISRMILDEAYFSKRENICTKQ